MIVFNNCTEATEAAELFFSENFGYNSGVGITELENNVMEFYSKDDPAMDDTFTCIIMTSI